MSLSLVYAVEAYEGSSLLVGPFGDQQAAQDWVSLMQAAADVLGPQVHGHPTLSYALFDGEPLGQEAEDPQRTTDTFWGLWVDISTDETARDEFFDACRRYFGEQYVQEQLAMSDENRP